MSGYPMPASDIASEAENGAEAPASPSTTAEAATAATAAAPPTAASRRGARATQAYRATSGRTYTYASAPTTEATRQATDSKTTETNGSR